MQTPSSQSVRFYSRLAALACVALPAHAYATGAAYVELGGSAVTGSVNVEVTAIPHVALRLGMGVAPERSANYVDSFRAVFPMGGSALIGGGANQLEVGATYLANSGGTWAANYGPAIYGPLVGWRLTTPGPIGVIVRATFTPQFQDGRRFYDVFPFGVSAGAHF